jgi:pimeloyl-ACP methyl ester carboxylesterase
MFSSKALNPDIETPTARRPPTHRGNQHGKNNRRQDEFYLPCGCLIRKNLVIFMGGAGDSAIKIMFKVAKEYQENHHAYQDVYYRTHSSGAHVIKLVETYHAAGRKVAVIGHSWGGSSAVHAVALKTDIPIDILATLDPVGRFQRKPPAKPSGVSRFINVYINYAKADLINIPNFVARVGGAWESVPCADENYDFNTEKRDSYPHNPDHAWARAMFSDFVKTHVEALG